MPLSLGVDTFFKRWQETRPTTVDEADRGIQWDLRLLTATNFAPGRAPRTA